MQNLVIGLVLIVLALLVGAVFVFHQFGPDLSLTPIPDMEVKAPDDESSTTLQVTVGGDQKLEEINAEARKQLSLEHAREMIEQAPGVITPSERQTLDEQRRFQHVVKKGETLISLAREYLGDATLWPKILEANTKALTRPEDLHEGQTVWIPTKDAR